MIAGWLFWKIEFPETEKIENKVIKFKKNDPNIWNNPNNHTGVLGVEAASESAHALRTGAWKWGPQLTEH